MPVIKSAIKKLRQDRKREKENSAFRKQLEIAISRAKKSSSKINAAYSLVDKAVKKGLIHKNKAARIKASLSKLAKPGKTPPRLSSKRAPSLRSVRSTAVSLPFARAPRPRRSRGSVRPSKT